jgi:hypothetical protein
MYYVAVDAQGRWLALLLFSAAAKHLKHRDHRCETRTSLIDFLLS